MPLTPVTRDSVVFCDETLSCDETLACSDLDPLLAAPSATLAITTATRASLVVTPAR